MTNADAILARGLLKHRTWLLRYEASTVTRLLGIYDAALKDVLAAASAAQAKAAKGIPVSAAEMARLKTVAGELTATIQRLQRVSTATLQERLAVVGQTEAAFHAGSLSEVGVSMVAIPAVTVATAITAPIGGGVWTARLAADLVVAHDGIQNALARGMARGASMGDIARLLGQVPDLAGNTRQRLLLIARTETQRVANTVAMESYAANEDVIGGVQILATLDSRTCQICGPLHEKTYPLKGGKPIGLERIPPFHPRCRCFLAPVTRSWEELGLTPRQQKLF